MEKDVFTGKYPREELAEIAYDAYGETTNFKNFRDEPMLEWSELPLKIKQAWCEAVIAVEKKINSPMAAFAPSMGDA